MADQGEHGSERADSGGLGTPPPTRPGVAPGFYPAPWGGTGWWDGRQWFATPPEPVDPYRPIARLARVVQVLFGALIAIRAVLIIRYAVRYAHAVDTRVDTRPLAAMLNGGGAASIALSLTSTVLSLLTMVAFLMWRHRVQRNLRGALQVRGLVDTPGWAVGWWFVPIVNFVKPKQGMDDAWRASGPEVPVGTEAWKDGPKPALITWWWALWVTGVLVGVDYRLSRSDGIVTAAEAHGLAVQRMLSLGLSIIAAYLAIRIVGEITERHRARARAFGIDDT